MNGGTKNMNGKCLHFSNLFFQLVVLILSLNETSTNNAKYFCEQNLFKTNSTWLQFTKEVNTFDYVVNERYKSLSCCAKGYNKFKWYKDGKLISDANKNITFHELEERNQTLVTNRVTEMDAGNYTCIASNSTKSINRTIQLEVLSDSTYMGRALHTFVSEGKQYAQIGESTRFFCEAYIGYGKKLTGVVKWVINDAKTNKYVFAETTDKRRYVQQMSRGENAIIGEYLIFTHVVKEDFTTYRCSITNGDTPQVFNVTLIEGDNPSMKVRTTYKATLVIIVVFTFICMMVIAIYIRWHLELSLFWKDRFGKLEDDNKEYDVFVCYDQTDAEFALGVLVHILENVYDYKCFAYERDSVAGDWIPEIYTMKIRSSRRFLMILSPALAENSWCTYALYVAIEAMLNLHSKIICIVLQDIPWKSLKPSSETSDHTLQQVLRVVRKVQWEPRVSRRSHFSMLKVCFSHEHKLQTLKSSDAFFKNSEESLSCVVDGSKENIINSVKHNETETDFGSKRFWTSLRIHFPPKRHADVKMLQT